MHVRALLLGAVGRVPMSVRDTNHGIDSPPLEFGRIVGDIQRAAKTDTGAALPCTAEDSIDSALRPTAQIAIGKRCRFAEPPLSVDPTDGVDYLSRQITLLLIHTIIIIALSTISSLPTLIITISKSGIGTEPKCAGSLQIYSSYNIMDPIQVEPSL